MSVQLLGAALMCGPKEQTPAFVLVAIADNADDYGVAVVSHEMLAHKSRCDERTVIRSIAALESAGWLSVMRKAHRGKCNAYVVNCRKLGVNVSPDARVSPLHALLAKTKGDTLSLIFASQKSGDTDRFSGDNPQPLQVTSAPTQVTKTGGTGDIACHTNRFNHEENHQEPSAVLNPRAPEASQANTVEDLGAKWSKVKTVLKTEIAGMTLRRKFKPVHTKENDFDGCFRDALLVEVRRDSAAWHFVLEAETEYWTRQGLIRYAVPLATIIRAYFPVPPAAQVRFGLRD